MSDETRVVQKQVQLVQTWTYRAGLDRLARSVLGALVTAVDWETWQTQAFPGHEDDGYSVAGLAELSGYSVRSVQRGLPGLVRDLDLDIISEGRKGRTNRYSLVRLIPRLEEAVARRKAEIAEDLAARAQRNEGKTPIRDPDYEKPRVSPRGPARTTKPAGLPSWLPENEVPEPWTIEHCVALVTSIGRSCFGEGTRTLGGLWRLTYRLWKARGFGDPEQLAREVDCYMNAARDCKAKWAQMELRGLCWVTVGGLPVLQQRGRNLTDPTLLKPGRLLAPVPFATRLGAAQDHARGTCACNPEAGSARRPSGSEPAPEAADVFAGEAVLRTIYRCEGPALPTDADVVALWGELRGLVRDRMAAYRGYDGWKEPGETEIALENAPNPTLHDGAMWFGGLTPYVRGLLAEAFEDCADLVPWLVALSLDPPPRA